MTLDIHDMYEMSRYAREHSDMNDPTHQQLDRLIREAIEAVEADELQLAYEKANEANRVEGEARLAKDARADGKTSFSDRLWSRAGHAVVGEVGRRRKLRPP